MVDARPSMAMAISPAIAVHVGMGHLQRHDRCRSKRKARGPPAHANEFEGARFQGKHIAQIAAKLAD